MSNISNKEIIPVGISVIVPTYNAERTIHLLLTALATQETNYTYDVTVVDNSSTDNTVAIVSSFLTTYPVALKIVSQPRGVTIATVRNYGVKNSNSKFLAFIDSDCEPPPDWLQNGGARLDSNQSPILLAGGCCPPLNGTWVQRAWHAIREGRKEGTFFVHGANFFIPREIFIELGGFREDLETSEDYDLGFRVAQKYKVVQAQELVVIHYGDADSLAKKFRKERWYGKNSWDMLSNNYLYKPFWLAVFYLLALMLLGSSFFCLAKGNTYFLFATLAPVLGTPILLAIYFCRRAGNYKFLLHMVPISFIYMLARGCGIIDGAIIRIKSKQPL